MKAATRDFLREHKKDIIIGTTVSVAVVVTGVVVYKNWDIIKGARFVKSILGTTKVHAINTAVGLEAATEYAVEEMTEDKIINIERFIRNLPDSWNASPEKIKQAKVLGIELAPHQTFVDSHTRCIA